MRKSAIEVNVEAGSPTAQTYNGSLCTLEHPFGGVHIIDRLFTPRFVEGLSEVLQDLPYRADRYVTPETEATRFFKAELEPRVLSSGLPILAAGRSPSKRSSTESESLSIVTVAAGACLKSLNPGRRDGRFVRIYANALPFGAHLVTHVDADADDASTVVYFANPEWPRDWHGELILCDETGEPLYAIAPAPGRFVIFPGNVLHRATPPSRACMVNRFTIAFKYQWGS